MILGLVTQELLLTSNINHEIFHIDLITFLELSLKLKN